MAVGVVDLFKIIEIEIDDTHLAIAPFRNGVARQLVDGIAVRQAGDNVGIGQHAQTLLGAALFGNIGAGADKIYFVFTAAAVDKFIAEEKQPLSFTGFNPAFNFVRTTALKKISDVTPRRDGFSGAHK